MRRADLDELDECEISPTDLKRVLVAAQGSPTLDEDDLMWMVAIEHDRIGEEATLRCVATKSNDKLSVERSDGLLTLSVESRRPSEAIVGWAPNDSTLILSSNSWRVDVRNVLLGKGEPASKGSLKNALSLADQKAQVWAAGRIPIWATPLLNEAMSKAPLALPEFKMSAIAASATSTPTSLTTKMVAHVGDPSVVEGYLSLLKLLRGLAMKEVPGDPNSERKKLLTSVVERVEFAGDGDRIEISLDVPGSVIEAMQASVREDLGRGRARADTKARAECHASHLMAVGNRTTQRQCP